MLHPLLPFHLLQTHLSCQKGLAIGRLVSLKKNLLTTQMRLKDIIDKVETKEEESPYPSRFQTLF